MGRRLSSAAIQLRLNRFCSSSSCRCHCELASLKEAFKRRRQNLPCGPLGCSATPTRHAAAAQTTFFGRRWSGQVLLRSTPYVLSRMYNYTGLLVRAISQKPGHVVGAVSRHWDSERRRIMIDTTGSQGHQGKFAPRRRKRRFDVCLVAQHVSWILAWAAKLGKSIVHYFSWVACTVRRK